jgi:hypothetical protein
MADIPNLPGVPSLPSYSTDSLGLLFEDAVSFLFGGNGVPSWGIFLDGEQAFAYTSVIDFDYKRDYTVSDYQVEDGGFQSYDKVQLPFDVKVRVVSGGAESDRQDLLNSVDAASNSLDLYDVVTPEMTYSSCNISHYDYKRTATNGVGMIVIDIWFVEIRVTSTSTFSSTQNPTTSGQQNTGSVSPTTPSASVQSDVSGGFQ